MKKETIVIQNLKCGGCVKSIVHLMESFPEVSDVSVSLEDASVTFTTPDEQPADKYRLALAGAGYPPEGDDNTVGRKAKSYVSCAIGRMS
ncbi:MAG: heavy-metal-associated domain-containing protein [Bacteroidota bacterium]